MSKVNSVNSVVTEFMELSAGKPEKGKNYSVVSPNAIIRLMAKEIMNLREELKNQ